MILKLGLDIGVASVGWGIIDENYNIIDSGVRIFPENTAKKNEDRRSMRSSRRRIRRKSFRLFRMKQMLKKVLTITSAEKCENIYEMRCRGLQERLTHSELYAAVLHLTKRRGTHYLTAEDFEAQGGEGISTEESLRQKAEHLKAKYVCEIQLQKYEESKKSGLRGVRGQANRFQNTDYRKELEALLDKQRLYYPQLESYKEQILKIYSAKREYYEGPGGENSPTPYGSYRRDKEGKLIKVNLIELMRGKCTYFPDESRMAQNAYTACLFNLLNDLNNMEAAGESIILQQKRDLVEQYVDQGKNVSLRAISKITDVKAELLRGYRVDKNDKPVFTEFTGYKDMLNALEKAGIDDAFLRGNRCLVDEIAEILTGEKDVEKRATRMIAAGLPDAAAHELKKLAKFTQYHSLSKKAIELILGDLWETDQNQMQLFSKAGLQKTKKSNTTGPNILFDGSDWIVSPITKRAVGEAVKIINAARASVRKKYGCEFVEIVIEMAREKNSVEQVEFINKIQKQNEAVKRQIDELGIDLKKINGKQLELLKLLIEQDFKCAYSLESIRPSQALLTGMLEVDHIVPRSLSFDDSLANKVAVLCSENQNKGQLTPFQYLKSGRGKVSYEEYKAWVLRTESYKKSKKKRENLLYEGDPQRDLTGFINRNLVDTRYACKEVLRLLQDYFRENQLRTKVSVIRGSFTYAFRKKASLAKDRNETYAHHAQDALIVAGLTNTDLMRNIDSVLHPLNMEGEQASWFQENGRWINRETGEIFSEEDFENGQYIRFIKSVDAVRPKYSHKVDRKPNRALYDQQIKSTREKEGKTYIIGKYKNIYGKGPGNSGEKLKKRILESPEDLLMYHHDRNTFDKLVEIVEAYSESKNPFADYFLEHGPVRKYSRAGNGPAVGDIKYYEKTLVSHRVNNKQAGKNLSVYLSIKSLRADIYWDQGMYKFISVPYDMVRFADGEYRIAMEKYEAAKQAKGLGASAQFLFSLHTGEMFEYEKDGEKIEWVYNCVNNDRKNVLETRFIDKPSPGNTQGKRMITIIKKISSLKKYHVDVLGNRHIVQQESFREIASV